MIHLQCIQECVVVYKMPSSYSVYDNMVCLVVEANKEKLRAMYILI